MNIDLAKTTIHSFPHAFITKRGDAILVHTLGPRHRRQLIEMYLAFRPRNCFSGLPPITDEACIRWVEGMIANGVNLVALAFEQGVVGHVGLFPIDGRACEIIAAVSRSHRRVGIGTELTRCCIQLAEELGFDEIKLNVEAGNHVARHVYEKCGFRYRSRGLVDELDMSLDLQRYRQTAEVPVRQIMRRRVLSIRPEMSCRDALRVFLADGIASLPVVDGHNRLVGILSETDLIDGANLQRKVSEVFTRDVVWVQEACPLEKLISLFRSRKLRCIPVLNRRRELVGVIGRRDVLAFYAGRQEAAARAPAAGSGGADVPRPPSAVSG